MSEPIKNRYEFVYLFDVENGNPNGDPDAGNMPRIDPETSHGLVTDVCLKRKIRNYIEVKKGNEQPYKIYVRERAVLTTERSEAYKSLSEEQKKDKQTASDLGREFMCNNFYDVRTFGAVMSTKENNCGQVRGPVQFAFARSIEPIVPLELSITRVAVETEAEREKERMMGRKHIVPYGLYRVEGFVSAHLAKQTGFTEEDLELLFEALTNMFDHDRSAARGEMNARKLIVFKHDSALGNAPAHNLFELVTVARAEAEKKPARSFSDYAVSIEQDRVPTGVTMEEKI
jgi:CRISPR-associated protein Csd2